MVHFNIVVISTILSQKVRPLSYTDFVCARKGVYHLSLTRVSVVLRNNQTLWHISRGAAVPQIYRKARFPCYLTRMCIWSVPKRSIICTRLPVTLILWVVATLQGLWCLWKFHVKLQLRSILHI